MDAGRDKFSPDSSSRPAFLTLGRQCVCHGPAENPVHVRHGGCGSLIAISVKTFSFYRISFDMRPAIGYNSCSCRCHGGVLWRAIAGARFAIGKRIAGIHYHRTTNVMPWCCRNDHGTMLRVDFGSWAVCMEMRGPFKPLLCFTSSFKQGLLLCTRLRRREKVYPA